MSERFTRNADLIGVTLTVAWLVSIPVLGILGIWWHPVWLGIPLGLLILWCFATGLAYDSRYGKQQR